MAHPWRGPSTFCMQSFIYRILVNYIDHRGCWMKRIQTQFGFKNITSWAMGKKSFPLYITSCDKKNRDCHTLLALLIVPKCVQVTVTFTLLASTRRFWHMKLFHLCWNIVKYAATMCIKAFKYKITTYNMIFKHAQCALLPWYTKFVCHGSHVINSQLLTCICNIYLIYLFVNYTLVLIHLSMLVVINWVWLCDGHW